MPEYKHGNKIKKKTFKKAFKIANMYAWVVYIYIIHVFLRVNIIYYNSTYHNKKSDRKITNYLHAFTQYHIALYNIFETNVS